MKHSVAKRIITISIMLFCVSFICNGINIFLFYKNLYLSDLDAEVSWQLEELKGELKEYEELDSWMKAWRLDSSGMNPLEDRGFIRVADEFEHFSRYSRLHNIICFYPVEGGEAFMFFEGGESDGNGGYAYVLGDSRPFNLDLHPNLKKCIDEGREEVVRDILNSSVDRRRFIQYYAPLFDQNGELICVISESVWWTDYILNILKGAVTVEVLNALFHTGILLILLFMLNKVVSHPMLTLKNSVVAYAEDKDTSGFVRSLIPLGIYDNELGILSEEVAVMAVELRRYMEENLALMEEKKRLEGRLAMAVDLKHQLMPNVFPAFPDEDRLEIYADQVAFEKIGGDYYDFFAIDRNHIAVVIADIFDGGTPSALFMVAFKIILSQIASYGLPPSKIMEVVNNRLSRYNEDDLTLSAWFGIYEISTGRVTAVNAGHECPLIVSKDGIKEIEEDVCGFIIGMAEGMSFPEYSFSLEPDSHLFLYTDGILNAVNSSGESFGYDRMIKVISDVNASCDAEDAPYESIQREIGAVQDAVFDFVGDEKLCVDLTMLILEREK